MNNQKDFPRSLQPLQSSNLLNHIVSFMNKQEAQLSDGQLASLVDAIDEYHSDCLMLLVTVDDVTNNEPSVDGEGAVDVLRHVEEAYSPNMSVNDHIYFAVEELFRENVT